MVHQIKIRRENKVYENKYGALYDDDVEFTSSGTTGTYVRWTWKSPYSVAVLPIVSDNDIVLIEGFRHSTRGVTLEVPKGFGNSDKMPIDVARDELREEAGLECLDMDYVGKTITDPAFAAHPMHLFIARNCRNCPSSPESSEVIINVKKISLSDITAVLREELIVDTISLLLISIANTLKEKNHESWEITAVPHTS